MFRTDSVLEVNANVEAGMPETSTLLQPYRASRTTIPENPYRVLMEIMMHPVEGYGPNAYVIPSTTAAKVFPNHASRAQILQDCKMKLQSAGILEVLRHGSKSHEVVVRVLDDNIQLRQGGRGRPAGKPEQAAAAKSATRRATIDDESDACIDSLRAHLRKPVARLEQYRGLMEQVLADYADIFQAQFVART